MPPIIITLYSKSDCRLCDEAREMLREQLPDGFLVYEYNIEEDAARTAEYGQMIPVLCVEELDRELAYPFDTAVLKKWLAELHRASSLNAVNKKVAVENSDWIQRINQKS